MAPHSYLVRSRPKGKSSPHGTLLFSVSCSAVEGASRQSAWENKAILFQDFSVGFVPIIYLCGLTVTCIGTIEQMHIEQMQINIQTKGQG